MDSDIQSYVMLFVALILVLMNGFFVLSEFAIVKVRRTKLEEFVKQGKRSASLALKMSNSLDTYLSATQLGITFSSLALGWIGEPALARLIESNVSFFENNPVLLHTISFTIAFSIVTFLHVVFGEIVPKSIAIAKAEIMVLYIARPLYMFWVVFYPLIKFFDIVAAFVLRVLGVKAATEHELAHSEEELRIIVNESFRGGHIDSIESEIIKNAVDFSETVAKEIMTPRKDMMCLNSEKSFEENIQRVLSTKHTRYPYCHGGKDNIVGMVHTRDLLNNALENKEIDISKLVRPVIMVPENTSISTILTRMNKSRIHLALVVDEYGGTSGLITLDDIIEEIIGETRDEHDPKTETIKKIDEYNYEIDGMVNIEKVEEILDITFEEPETSVTIGGRIFNLIGRLPFEGETIEDKGCTYKILEVGSNRVKKILFTKKDTEAKVL